MAKSLKYKRIYDPMFRVAFYYYDCKTPEDFARRIFKDFKIKDVPTPASAAFVEYKDMLFIWGPRRYPAIIAHECVHCAFYVLDRVGVPIKYENDEIFAYYVNFLMAEIYSLGGKNSNG